MTRNLIGYGGQPLDFTWPNGQRLAVSVVVNFEAGAEQQVGDGDPLSERMGEVISVVEPGTRDMGQEQIFAYGIRAGIWRFFDALEVNRIPRLSSAADAPSSARLELRAGLPREAMSSPPGSIPRRESRTQSPRNRNRATRVDKKSLGGITCGAVNVHETSRDFRVCFRIARLRANLALLDE